MSKLADKLHSELSCHGDFRYVTLEMCKEIIRDLWRLEQLENDAELEQRVKCAEQFMRDITEDDNATGR